MTARFIAIWGLTAIVSAVLAGVLAGLKRRDHSFWAAWSFFIPPMILILVCLPKNHGPIPRRPHQGHGDEPFV